ncbi:MAG: hypothetical protein RLZZ127_2503 [Planctomycetota bacterium]
MAEDPVMGTTTNVAMEADAPEGGNGAGPTCHARPVEDLRDAVGWRMIGSPAQIVR